MADRFWSNLPLYCSVSSNVCVSLQHLRLRYPTAPNYSPSVSFHYTIESVLNLKSTFRCFLLVGLRHNQIMLLTANGPFILLRFYFYLYSYFKCVFPDALNRQNKTRGDIKVILSLDTQSCPFRLVFNSFSLALYSKPLDSL